jgi:hypothetical protein
MKEAQKQMNPVDPDRQHCREQTMNLHEVAEKQLHSVPSAQCRKIP